MGFLSDNHISSQEKKQSYQVLVLQYAVKYIGYGKLPQKTAVEGNNTDHLLIISSANWKQM